MTKKKYIAGIIILSCIVLGSCKVGRSYQRPIMTDMPDTFEISNSQQSSIADIGWSTLYTDTILQKLIGQALDYNKDVLIATARIKEMIANKRITFANILPEVGLDALAQREYLNYGGDNKKFSPEIHTDLTFGWELDIWGKLRWANEAGVAEYMQSVEAQKALRLTIVSQVAQSYFELKALDRELEIVRQTLEARKEGVHFAKLRYEGGLTSEITYRQSMVELARTETLIPSLENQIKLKENDLSILLGRFPSEVIRSNTDISKIPTPPNLPVDLPSTLLQRRPDVAEAEQRLIAANAEVGVALTSMFPSLKLTGRLGGENSELANFLKSPTWFISSALTGPLFNFGKNKATHNAAKAAYEQVVYSYEKTVQNVFKEVNNAINSFQKAKEVRASREKLYESVQSYQNLSRLQYVNGVIAYMDLLDAQRQLFDAEIALNDAILAELNSVVMLYKVLGGGSQQ